MNGTFLLIVLLALCFMTAVLLAAAETSLIRVRRVRIAVLAADGRRGARRVLRLLDDLPAVLNTILLVVLLVQIGAATATGLLAERWFGSWGITIGSVLLTFILFVYSEAIPKTYAYRHPATVAVAIGYPVAILITVWLPVARLLARFADLHLPRSATAPTVTERELRLLAAEAAGEGQITEDDRHFIERVFHLGDLAIEEVMVPRPDIAAVPAETSAADALEVAVRTGHHRLLVHHGDLDDLLGVVSLRDLAHTAGPDPGLAVTELTVPPLVVPVRTRVVRVLQEMQQRGVSLAVVIDEHGGTAGLVTEGDVAAEFLGPAADDAAADVASIRRSADGRFLVGGMARVDDLELELGIVLPEGDWTTVGGLVMGLSGRVPRVGDEVVASGYRFRVTATSRRRVGQIEVRAEVPTG